MLSVLVQILKRLPNCNFTLLEDKAQVKLTRMYSLSINKVVFTPL